jgi:hypothetical protein|tara:strand:+ start:2008 stop:2211 length:204 start_codon:yes stop_codon:yes gene_type:complete
MQLSKADNLKSRVLMAKANIPFIKISSQFIERFPKYIGEEERVKNMLLLRNVHEGMLEDLESFSKQF